MSGLTERHLYVLPSGTLVVASVRAQGEWGLFTLEEWERGQGCGYSVTSDGRVLHAGKPTDWTVGDLREVPAAVPERGRSGWG